MNQPFRHKWSFRISIATLMITLVILLSAAFLALAQYNFGKAAEQSADRLFDEISGKLAKQVDGLLTAGQTVCEAGAFLFATLPGTPAMKKESILLFMANTLQQNEQLHALFVAEADGSLVRMVALRGNPALLEIYGSGREARFIVITEDGQGRPLSEEHLDTTLRPVARKDPGQRAGRGTARPWQEPAADGLRFAGPYIFSREMMPGIACSRSAPLGLAVFGAEITLAHFTDFLFEQEVSANGQAFLFSAEGYLLAHPWEPAVTVARRGEIEEIWFVPLDRALHPEVRAIGAGWDGVMSKDNSHLSVAGRQHIVRRSALGKSGLGLFLAIIAPVSDFTGSFHLLRRQVLGLSGLAVCVAIVISLVLARRVSFSLSRLAASAERVQQFDFSKQDPLDSIFIEIHSLIVSFSLMRRTVRQRTEALLITQSRLQQLVDDGIALAAQKNDRQLARHAFEASRDLALAEGGLLMVADSKGRLSASLSQLPTADASVTEIDISAGMIGELIDDDAVRELPRHFEAGWSPELVRQLGVEEAGRLAGLLVPLRSRRDRLVGMLLLVRRIDVDNDDPTGFDHERFPFLELLAAQAATAMDNLALIRDQERLMDSFIKVLADAIDTKSPHTGRHCARVPELALMLAAVADAATNGPLASFRLEGEAAWREYEVAAWLHDCGKVTTPDHVVNKATKLETGYNRIHEIRTRFEVLWRDLEIEFLRELAGDRSPDAKKEALLADRQRQLADEFTFVAACNIGGEATNEADRERLMAIAARTWIRRFDDSLGLSEEERSRRENNSPLDNVERLLADKAEHLVSFGTDGRKGVDWHRFNLHMPHYRFNNGELHNLLVERGTLTAEERFAIQDHIVQTIRMLDQLPFPPHLARVPEYACRHHEKVNGTGYPLGLTGEEMSVPARILAIADIFEALTAADRPYRQPMRVAEAMRLMASMAEAGEIDADLFALFACSDVTERYGRKYLMPEQFAV